MRRNRGLLTSVAVCLTVFFIVLNSKSTVETINDTGSSIEKPYAGEQEVHKGQVNCIQLNDSDEGKLDISKYVYGEIFHFL